MDTISPEILTYEEERGKPIPSLNHVIVQTNLILALGIKYLDIYRILSELTILFKEERKIPDLSLYNKISFQAYEDKAVYTDPPLLAIEILSPKQKLGDLSSKCHLYFDNGVKSYWLVIPELRSIYVFKNPEEYNAFHLKETLTDEQMDIELSLVDIFN